MVFHWILSDTSPQVSSTLLSILADLNNAVIWIVSTHSLMSKSSNPFTQNTNKNWYNCHFHVPQLLFFFQFPRKVEVLILLFAFFQLYSVISRDSIIIIIIIDVFVAAVAGGGLGKDMLCPYTTLN